MKKHINPLVLILACLLLYACSTTQQLVPKSQYVGKWQNVNIPEETLTLQENGNAINKVSFSTAKGFWLLEDDGKLRLWTVMYSYSESTISQVKWENQDRFQITRKGKKVIFQRLKTL